MTVRYKQMASVLIACTVVPSSCLKRNGFGPKGGGGRGRGMADSMTHANSACVRPARATVAAIRPSFNLRHPPAYCTDVVVYNILLPTALVSLFTTSSFLLHWCRCLRHPPSYCTDVVVYDILLPTTLLSLLTTTPLLSHCCHCLRHPPSYCSAHFEHRFPAPTSRLCQNWSRH